MHPHNRILKHMRKLVRTHKAAFRSMLGFACVAVIAFVFVLPKTHQHIAIAPGANSLEWSEQLGAGEVFAACASSPVNGVCDMSAANSCAAGTLGANAIQPDGAYQWYCDGTDGGASSSLCWYYPPVPVVGQCDNSAVNACAVGTLGANAKQPDGTYQWYCDGSNGGARSDLCWYAPPAPPTPVAGACAASATPSGGNGNYPINDCSSGTLGRNSLQTTPYEVYYWYCNGSDGTEGPLCWYTPPPPPTPVTGACATSATPSGGSGSYPINGCSSGTLGANAPQANGNYHWYCDGSNGGSGSDLCWYAPPADAPTASLSASPASVSSGDQSTLSWSSSNATSCSAGGPWSNSGTLSGSGLTNPLYTDTTFTFQCSGPAGTSPVRSAAVSVIGAGSCSIPWGGTIGDGSSVTAYNTPTVSSSDSCTTHSETRTCTNGVLSGSYTNQFCSTSASVVTASLSASPETIVAGQSSTLTWSSTNAVNCTSPGGFSTGNATSGSAAVSPVTTSAYSVICTGSNGSLANAHATVAVVIPVLSITAKPDRVLSGGSTTVTWSATNVNSCNITRNGVSWKSLTADASKVISGSSPDTITGQTTYVLSCKDINGVAIAKAATVIVNISPVYQEF